MVAYTIAIIIIMIGESAFYYFHAVRTKEKRNVMNVVRRKFFNKIFYKYTYRVTIPTS